MKLFEKKKFPIKIDDEELIKEIEYISNRRYGFKIMILDMADARCKLSDQTNNWWDKVVRKYNINKKYRNKLEYIQSKKEIKLNE